MKAFVVFAAVLACAYAKPQIIYNGLGHVGIGNIGFSGIHVAASPITYSAAPAITYAAAPIAIAPAVTSSQYHAQDELGQYTYGYAGGPSAKSESKDAFGNVQGAYSYIGADGKQVVVNYVADAVNGFRVAANNLPVAPVANLVSPLPVADTAEVAQAKAAHQQAIQEAEARNAEADKKDAAEGLAPQEPIPVPAAVAVAPLPVQDTPEVVAAKISHAAAHADALARSGRKKRGVVGLTYGAIPALGYSTHIASPVAYSTVVSAPSVAYSTHSVVAAPALTYATTVPAAVTYAAPAVVSQPLREATLTKVINTPGHAVSYRVD